MNVRNRWFLLFTALISVALVAAVACGGGTSSSDKTATAGAGGGGKTPAASAAAGAADKAPADQQKITIQSPEPEFVDPHRSNFEQDIGLERMLFRGLYNLTDDGNGGVKVVPGMAAARADRRRQRLHHQAQDRPEVVGRAAAHGQGLRLRHPA